MLVEGYVDVVELWDISGDIADAINCDVDLTELLCVLAGLNVNLLWVEAGSKLATSFWQQHLIDELVLYQAPLLLGADAMPLLNAGGIEQLSQAPRWQWRDVRQVGVDVRLTAYLKKATTPEQ